MAYRMVPALSGLPVAAKALYTVSRSLAGVPVALATAAML